MYIDILYDFYSVRILKGWHDKIAIQNLLVCTGISHTDHSPALQQVQDNLEGQLKEARQKNAAKQDELKEAAKKAAVAQQQELHDRLEALKQSLEQATANHKSADQVCVLYQCLQFIVHFDPFVLVTAYSLTD